MKPSHLLALAALAAFSTLSAADAPAGDAPAADAPSATAAAAARLAAARKVADSLKYQTGVITLQDGLAKINLPDNFRYLDPAQTDTLLHTLWGNPPNPNTLGTIVASNFDPLNPTSWAVIITYNADGYVKDDDASSIDYGKLMTEMQQNDVQENKQRTADGYPALHTVGWAEPPHYDQATHKLFWALDLQADGDTIHSLNYNIRMLGRKGVLVLNAIAGMPQLADVKVAAPKIISMVDFEQGNRYADFDASTDKVAAYGIAALVAGGIAAKAGLFKALWVGILAAKKVIIVAAVAIAGFVKKMWARFTGRAKT
jgi:uncharacterized membrane-anchored protein